jgi:spore germination cell wall hydrolase CwlJ-like protein
MLSKDQLECLSKAAYFESKGESDAGMLAVIHTTLNRVKDVRFPKTVCGVVYQRSQYSWAKHNPKIKEKDQYERAKRLAQEVVEGKHKDISKGALYFNSLHKQPKGTVCTVRVGGHSFYKPVTPNK